MITYSKGASVADTSSACEFLDIYLGFSCPYMCSCCIKHDSKALTIDLQRVGDEKR